MLETKFGDDLLLLILLLLLLFSKRVLKKKRLFLFFAKQLFIDYLDLSYKIIYITVVQNHGCWIWKWMQEISRTKSLHYINLSVSKMKSVKNILWKVPGSRRSLRMFKTTKFFGAFSPFSLQLLMKFLLTVESGFDIHPKNR